MRLHILGLDPLGTSEGNICFCVLHNADGLFYANLFPFILAIHRAPLPQWLLLF